MIAMVALIALWSFTPLAAQEMKGLGTPGMQQMKEMAGPGLPTPNLLITTLKKSVVVSDQAMPFAPLGMGKDFLESSSPKWTLAKGLCFPCERPVSCRAAK